jgi:hypothetical protein
MSESDSESIVSNESGILTPYCWMKTDKKKSKFFYVTIQNINEQEEEKLEVFNQLESKCEQLMVADTSFNSTLDLEHRLYVRLKKIVPVDTFGKFIKSIYKSQLPRDINIETPRHSRLVRNCSQYDVKPIFKELCEDEFSIVFQTHKWAINTKSFTINDPFLRAHNIKLEYAKKYHKSLHASMESLIPLKKINQVKKLYSWQDEVIEWFNNWLDGEDFSDSKKHLYLYGETNTGKTYFILHYLFLQYRKQIFRPCLAEEKYAFSHFDPKDYNILIEDEFDLDVSFF